MTGQSRLESLIEVFMNILSGFILAFIVQQWVITPLFNLQTSGRENFIITLIFTVVSIIRGYVWRRVFNNKWPHMLLQKLSLPGTNSRGPR